MSGVHKSVNTRGAIYCYLLVFLTLRVLVQIRSLFLPNYDSAKVPVVFI